MPPLIESCIEAQDRPTYVVEGVYELPRSECLVVPGRIRVHEFATPVDQ